MDGALDHSTTGGMASSPKERGSSLRQLRPATRNESKLLECFDFNEVSSIDMSMTHCSNENEESGSNSNPMTDGSIEDDEAVVSESDSDATPVIHRRSNRSSQSRGFEYFPSSEGESDGEDGSDHDFDRRGDPSSEEDVSNDYRVTKFLARRYFSNDLNESMEERERFLVKWKHYPYILCSWISRKQLMNCRHEKGHFTGFLNRLKKEEDEDDNLSYTLAMHCRKPSHFAEFFNPEFLGVDRIVSHEAIQQAEDETMPGQGIYRELEVAGEPCDALEDACDLHFLVKWKGLDYEECTWTSYRVLRHLDQVVLNEALTRYWNFQSLKASRKILETFGYKEMSRSWKKSHSRLEFPEIPFRTNFKLRDYQVEGVKWLAFNWGQSRNSIIADEMGLGKTMQVVSFLKYLKLFERVRRPYLVVAPLSTLQHWRREFESRGEIFNCIIYHGTRESRKIIREYEFQFEDEAERKKRHHKFDVVITTYEMIMTDFRGLCLIDWECLVLDEAHRIKNQDSRSYHKLQSIHHRHCILLTGTPIQNRVDELWALLHFLDYDSFPVLDDFLEEFGTMSDQETVEKLHQLLRPYLLRRLKDDVETDLPPRQEIVIDVELTAMQKKYYKAVYEKNVDFLINRGTVNALRNIWMQIRKICLHPYLIDGAEKTVVNDTMTEKEKMDLLIQHSGKCVLLDKLLPKLRSEGQKVLIFSQFKIMLDILEDYAAYRNYPLERIDGSITGVERQDAIDNFSREDSDSFLFLLTTRAGGVGINLTAATTCIIFDSDWNPQNDLQAMARCHRIGQTKEVKVYRLVTKNTYEEKMFDEASLKLGLDQAILHPITKSSSKSGDPVKTFNREQVENLLKHGAYYILREELEDDAFVTKDIDDILANSSRLIRYDAAPNQSKSSFSKASFVTSGGGDVDMNDPNFWEKMGLKHLPEDVKPIADSPLPRKRRRVQRYSDLGRFQDSKKGMTTLGVDLDFESASSSSDDDDDQVGDARVEDGLNPAGTSSETPLVEPTKTIGEENAGTKEQSKRNRWITSERDLVETTLLKLGWGKWDAVRLAIAGEGNEASIAAGTDPLRTDRSIERMAVMYIRQLLQAYFDSEASPQAIKDWVAESNLLLNQNRHPLQRLLLDSGFQTSVSNVCTNIANNSNVVSLLYCLVAPAMLNSKRYLIYLHADVNTKMASLNMLSAVHQIIQRCQWDASLVASAGLDPLVSWWKPLHDFELLRGVQLYGLDAWRAIDSDDSLVFKGSLAQEVSDQALNERLEMLVKRIDPMFSSLTPPTNEIVQQQQQPEQMQCIMMPPQPLVPSLGFVPMNLQPAMTQPTLMSHDPLQLLHFEMQELVGAVMWMQGAIDHHLESIIDLSGCWHDRLAEIERRARLLLLNENNSMVAMQMTADNARQMTRLAAAIGEKAEQLFRSRCSPVDPQMVTMTNEATQGLIHCIASLASLAQNTLCISNLTQSNNFIAPSLC
jgi:chromodomain-helicase-DNA-binding protein 7